jgi:hypothetical protein
MVLIVKLAAALVHAMAMLASGGAAGMQQYEDLRFGDRCTEGHLRGRPPSHLHCSSTFTVRAIGLPDHF